jgi:hypothetical protein
VIGCLQTTRGDAYSIKAELEADIWRVQVARK